MLPKKRMQNSHPLTTIIPLALVCTLLLGYQYLGAAWSEPAGSPTSNNVDAPINVGSTAQVKNGALSVDALAVFGDVAVTGTTSAQQINAAAYCDENGENCSAGGESGSITLHLENFEVYGDVMNAHVGCQTRGHDGVWAGMDGGGTENIICYQSSAVTDIDGLMFNLRHTHNGNVQDVNVVVSVPKSDLWAYAWEHCNAQNNPAESIAGARWNTTYSGDGQLSGLSDGAPTMSGGHSQVRSLASMNVGDTISAMGNTGGCSGSARIDVTLISE